MTVLSKQEKPLPPFDLWAAIPEIKPDEWDLDMLNDMKNDPECFEFFEKEGQTQDSDGLVERLA